MIPGIDMLNHSTRPEDVNTTLQRRTETVSKHSSSHAGSMDFSGFFAIEAGKSLSHCCLMSLLRVQKWGSIVHTPQMHKQQWLLFRVAFAQHGTISDTCCNMLGLQQLCGYMQEHWPLMCHSGGVPLRVLAVHQLLQVVLRRVRMLIGMQRGLSRQGRKS